MIKLGDKILRNLEEQVQYLTNYHDVNQGLVQWGIRVVGRVATEDELPDPATYQGEYGDAIAVGTAAPFSFYIWTRASIEGGADYWFPFGRISIIGPQGIPGKKGEKGDTGESSKWYYSDSPSNPREGDMKLMPNGDVYRYQMNDQSQYDWVKVTNIMGPQGVQGPVGPKGEQGVQGEKGEKGDTGDVGGFINIQGILGSTEQLPTPASLNNLTAAYLIGAQSPYDLWVQIGENSDVAVWTNTGPFNAGTLVSVNGNYQNVWNADTKLDKATEIPPADSAYVEKKGGGQKLIKVISGNPAPETIVKRNGNGQIATAEPTEDNHAATKKYVDGKSGVKDATVGGWVITPDSKGRLIIKLNSLSGLHYTTSGITIDPLYAPAIDSRTNSITSFNAYYIDMIVRDAMCDGKGAAWTETEKEAACGRMGAASKAYVDGRTAGAYFCGSVWYPGNGAGTGVKINNVWIPYPPFRKDQTQTLNGHTTDTGWDAGQACDVDYNIKYSVDALQAKGNAPANSIQVTLNGTYYETDFSSSQPIPNTLTNQTYNAVYLSNQEFEQTVDTNPENDKFYYTLYEA